jgi:23S rRNA pseudouridine1911/1915/1917 synthase
VNKHWPCQKVLAGNFLRTGIRIFRRMPLPTILHEDDALIAFDKPSGLAVSSERRDRAPMSLLAEARARYGPELHNVHRLDTGASGVLLCAKTKAALDSLSGQFQSKSVDKRYLALVAVLPAERAMRLASPIREGLGGLPAEFTLDLALGEDEAQRGRMRVCNRRDGKASTTVFRVLESFGALAWLDCRPLTGRTHQIRVHLAAVGAPVLNDEAYGEPAARLLLSDLKRSYKGRDEERPLIDRLALHASELGVKHPLTGEPLRLAAPLPREFEIALRNLRRYAPAGFAKR